MGFISGFGRIAYYLYGVKPGSQHSGLVTVQVKLSVKKTDDIKERLERLQSSLPVLALGISAITGILLGLHWKL